MMIISALCCLIDSNRTLKSVGKFLPSGNVNREMHTLFTEKELEEREKD